VFKVVGAAVWAPNSSVTPAELRAYAGKRLAKFKVPDEINIFMHADALPKGDTGKVISAVVHPYDACFT